MVDFHFGKFVCFEFLVLWGVGIIKIPLFQWNIFADNRNISLKKQLIQYTTDGLCAVLELIGEFTGNAAWSLASSLVSMCASAGYAYSNACYAQMYKRLDSSYTYYVQYWYMYWNSSYTDFCDRYTQTIYQ